MTNTKPLNTRFAPSPTGYLHVGGARTALFNYLLAKRTGGRFLLRIEDTDVGRHQEDAIPKIIDDLRWLGLTWDEGIEVGGDRGPYRQSQRLEVYNSYVNRLIDEGKAYYAFDTAEELDALRKVAEEKKENFRYQRPAVLPTAQQAASARSEGRPVVVRLMCESADVTIQDDAFGEVTMPGDQIDDFIIQKADGYPTYHLANVVDDALMGVTYIMRGQEFLGQTWRHVLLRRALGFAEPGYCHLPLIMDMKGRKLSKRDGDVEVHAFRVAGYLPEALVNFIALLGWGPGLDREKFTLSELVEVFSVNRIGKTNAKFDRDKLLAFNTDAVAAADDERLLSGFKDYLSLNDTPIPADDENMLRKLISINRSMRTFADVVAKSAVLFLPDDAFEYDPKAVEKVLTKGDGAGVNVLVELRDLLANAEWTAPSLEKLLQDYCESHQLGVGKVAQPLRVAATGGTISPPIFDTLVILGKAKTLARINRCLAMLGR